jgi:hypothetical protein
MTSRETAKRAENEAVFRDANERIEAAALALDPPVERVPFICECADASCRETIPLTHDEYEHVRADGAVFVIVVGHATEDEIVEEQDGYAVIRKTGGAGAIARARDRRRAL